MHEIFTNTGHLAGSAAINLMMGEDGKDTRICYSGDVGKYGSVLLAPPANFPNLSNKVFKLFKISGHEIQLAALIF